MSHSTLDINSLAHRRHSVTSVMLHVLLALLPGTILYALIIDSRLLTNILWAVVAALCVEAVMLALRKRPVFSTLQDGSIFVAAVLLTLSLPQGLPTWQLLLGIFVMCSLGKHVFGGLGHNPFNPAMVAYALLIISFPQSMTQWSSEHGFLDTAPAHYDGITSATPLERIKVDLQQMSPSAPATQAIEKDTANEIIWHSDWTLLAAAWALGGVYLLVVKIISWRIPFTVLGSLGACYFVVDLLSTTASVSAPTALFSGAIMFGAFFIATDPVSSAASNPGKLIYGCGIGLMCFFIREFSHFPEGFAFAVLLMNMCVPLIDHASTRNTTHIKGSARKGPLE